MNYHQANFCRLFFFPARLNFGRYHIWIAGVATALFLAGCSSPKIGLQSTPPGASVSIDDGRTVLTPAMVEFPSRPKPYQLAFSKAGFEGETVQYVAGKGPAEVNVVLAPLVETKGFRFQSDPTGAEVRLMEGNGTGLKVLGRTPLDSTLTFTRADKNAPWSSYRVELILPKHETARGELQAVGSESQMFQLPILEDTQIFAITAATATGVPLNATASLDGLEIGRLPREISVTFSRSSSKSPWSKSQLLLTNDLYEAQTVSVERDGPRTINLTLAPLTSILVPRHSPEVVMTAVGPELRISSQTSLALIDKSDSSTELRGLRPVTAFELPNPKLRGRANQSLNSFAVTPDGGNIILGLTSQDEKGAYYSNLFLKSATDVKGGFAQLTFGSGFLDAAPCIQNDKSDLLIFQSNRGDRRKTDIFRADFARNSIRGGLARITNDERFNFGPSYADANREVFYLSLETNYALAKPMLSSVRVDGSLPTQFHISADEVSQRESSRIFFSTIDKESKKRQIFFTGTHESVVNSNIIKDERFRNANCFNPVSGSGENPRILFVSDVDSDDQQRLNNNIYVMDSDGTNVRRLTDNGSDDIQPAWSPTERNTIYFISNRGGAYNVWRAEIAGR